MTNPYPLPRQLRQTDVFVGNGGAAYGPFSFRVFDVSDVRVFRKGGADVRFVDVTGAVTITKTSSAAFSHFTVLFAAPIDPSVKVIVMSSRVQERAAGVRSGTRLSSDAIEKEFSVLGTIVQELRRDVDRAHKQPFGEGEGVTLTAGQIDAAEANAVAAQSARDAAIAAAASIDKRIYSSLDAAMADDIPGFVTRLDTQFRHPDSAVAASLDGGGSYRRVSLADLAGYPAEAFFRSQDRFMPDGSVHEIHGGYWLLDVSRPTYQMFGARGDGLHDDTAACNAAHVFSRLSGRAVAMLRGVYLVNGLTVFSGMTIAGENMDACVFKLQAGANADVLKGDGSDALWNSGSLGGVSDFVLTDFTIDGNRAENVSGHGVAVYGYAYRMERIRIRHVPQKGMRTEWGGYGGDEPGEFGMEAYYSDIYIDTCGEDGWQNHGPHDSVAMNVIIVDGAQNQPGGAPIWDGIRLDGAANMRMIACHVWSRADKARFRYGVRDLAGGSEIVGCHIEGAWHANVYLEGQRTVIAATKIYAAWNGTNIVIKGSSNLVDAYVSDPGAGRPQCFGCRLGDGGPSDHVSNNVLLLSGVGQELGFVDFTHSNGGNLVRVQGYNGAGGAYAGTPAANDTVELHVSGPGGGVMRKAVIAAPVAAAGDTQASATPLSGDPVHEVGLVAVANQGVRLFRTVPGVQHLIVNHGGNQLYVYPPPGGYIGQYGMNAPVPVAVGKSALFTCCTTAGQWAVLLSA